MENNVQEKIAGSYKLIMWGILLTAAHITIISYQVVPAFVGHIMMYVGIKRLYEEVGIEYFADSLKSVKTLLVLSIIHWIWRAVIGLNTVILTGCIEVLVLVMELSLLGEFLNKTVKLLKENERVKQADKLRSNRMLFIKFYLGVLVVYLLGLIPALDVLGGYPALTLMLSLKIFLSLMVQTVIRCQVGFNPATLANTEREAK